MVNSLVSICIPTYNGAKYLQEALDSVICQTYRNFEVIISDDNSTDNTISIIEDFQKSVIFPVHVFHHSPSGIGANWNNCLKNANGEYIKFLFQDDVLFPECIEEMVSGISKDANLGLVASKRSFLVEGKVDLFLEDWISTYNDLQKGLNLPAQRVNILDRALLKDKKFLQIPHNKIGEPSVVLFKTSILKKTGFFREDLQQILDAEFYYRILKNYRIAIINKELVAFRLHPGQMTNVNRKKFITDYRDYDKILYNEFFWYLNVHQQKRLFFKFNLIGNVIRNLKYAAISKK